MRVLALALAGLLVGCASSSSGRGPSSSAEPYYLPVSDENSGARWEAFSADSMYTRQPMPDHRDSKPWEFYFKHCSDNGNGSYYSKTSYDCSGPYY